MKTIQLFLAVLLTASVSFAQERQIGGQVQLVNSPGTGNTLGVGAKVDAAIPLNDFLTAIAEAGWLIEPKGYVGDGWALRGRADLRFYPFRDGLYVQAGAASVYQHTSDYSKTAYFATVGAGYNWNDRVIVGAKYYLPERQTLNRVRALEVQGDVFLPLNDTRWLVRIGGGVTRTTFFQPWGTLQGWQTSWAPQVSAGFARTF